MPLTNDYLAGQEEEEPIPTGAPPSPPELPPAQSDVQPTLVPTAPEKFESAPADQLSRYSYDMQKYYEHLALYYNVESSMREKQREKVGRVMPYMPPGFDPRLSPTVNMLTLQSLIGKDVPVGLPGTMMMVPAINLQTLYLDIYADDLNLATNPLMLSSEVHETIMASDMYATSSEMPAWDYRTATANRNGKPLSDFPNAISFDYYGLPYYGSGYKGVAQKISGLWEQQMKIDIGSKPFDRLHYNEEEDAVYYLESLDEREAYKKETAEYTQKRDEETYSLLLNNPEDIGAMIDHAVASVDNAIAQGMASDSPVLSSLSYVAGEIFAMAGARLNARKIGLTALWDGALVTFDYITDIIEYPVGITYGLLEDLGEGKTYREYAAEQAQYMYTKEYLAESKPVTQETGILKQISAFVGLIGEAAPRLAWDIPRLIKNVPNLSWSDVKTAWDENVMAARIGYSCLINPMIKEEFLRHAMAGEDLGLLEIEFALPWSETTGRTIADPLNFAGKAGKILTDALRTQRITKTSLAAGKMDDMFKTLKTLTSEPDIIAHIDDMANEVEALRLARSTAMADEGAQYGALALTAEAKRWKATRKATNLTAYLAGSGDVDNFVDDLTTIIKLASDDRAEVMDGLLHAANSTHGRVLLSQDAIDTGLLLRKMLTIVDGVLDYESFVAGFKIKQAAVQAAVLEGKIDDIGKAFYDLGEYMKGKTDDALRLLYPKALFDPSENLELLAKFPDIVPPAEANIIEKGLAHIEAGLAGKTRRALNSFYGTLYMGLSPGYAMRNMISNNIHILFDVGIGAFAKTLEQQAVDIVSWLHAIPATTFEGFGIIGGEQNIAQIIGETGWKKWWGIIKGGKAKGEEVYHAFARLSAEFERRASIRVVGTTVERTMIKAIKPGKALPDAKLLLNAGFNEHEVQLLRTLTIKYKGDVRLASRELLDLVLGGGGIDSFQSLSWVDDTTRVLIEGTMGWDKFQEIVDMPDLRAMLKEIDAVYESQVNLAQQTFSQLSAVQHSNFLDELVTGQAIRPIDYKVLTDRMQANSNAFATMRKARQQIYEDAYTKISQMLRSGDTSAADKLEQLGKWWEGNKQFFTEAEKLEAQSESLIHVQDAVHNWQEKINALRGNDPTEWWITMRGVLGEDPPHGLTPEQFWRALWDKLDLGEDMPVGFGRKNVKDYLWDVKVKPNQFSAFRNARENMYLHVEALYNEVTRLTGIDVRRGVTYAEVRRSVMTAREMDNAMLTGGLQRNIGIAIAHSPNEAEALRLVAARYDIAFSTATSTKLDHWIVQLVKKYNPNVPQDVKTLWQISLQEAIEAFEARRVVKNLPPVIPDLPTLVNSVAPLDRREIGRLLFTKGWEKVIAGIEPNRVFDEVLLMQSYRGASLWENLTDARKLALIRRVEGGENAIDLATVEQTVINRARIEFTRKMYEKGLIDKIASFGEKRLPVVWDTLTDSSKLDYALLFHADEVGATQRFGDLSQDVQDIVKATFDAQRPTRAAMPDIPFNTLVTVDGVGDGKILRKARGLTSTGKERYTVLFDDGHTGTHIVDRIKRMDDPFENAMRAGGYVPIPYTGGPITMATAAYQQLEGMGKFYRDLGKLMKKNYNAFIPNPNASTRAQDMIQAMEKYLAGWIDDSGKYVIGAEQRIDETRMVAMNIGEAMREFTLHSYPLKTNLDVGLSYLYPYHFWYTRTYTKWFTERMLRNPNVFSAYARYKDTMAKIHADLPDWWKYQINTDELLGIDTGNPYLFNLELAFNPLQGLVGVDFNDPLKRVNWISSAVDQMGKFGPTMWSPFQIALAIGLGLSSRDETITKWNDKLIGPEERAQAAARWAGRLLPFSPTIKAATALGREALPGIVGGLLSVPPGGTDIDPWVQIFSGGTDPYERGRVGRNLGYLAYNNFKDTTPEAFLDAAYYQKGPLWDQAKQMATLGRASSTMSSFLLGAGFKARTHEEMVTDQFYADYNAFWSNAGNLSPDEVRNGIEELRKAYPFMDVLLLARKDDVNRFRTYAYNVLSRIPPGETTEVMALVGYPDMENLTGKFFDKKGDMRTFSEAEKKAFVAAVETLGALLELPDSATKEEWNAVKAEYDKMLAKGNVMWGEQIEELVSVYFGLVEQGKRDEASQFRDDHQAIVAYLDWKNYEILKNPLMMKYYGGMEKWLDWQTGLFYQNVREVCGDNIWDKWREWGDLEMAQSERSELWDTDPFYQEYSSASDEFKATQSAIYDRVQEQVEALHPGTAEALKEYDRLRDAGEKKLANELRHLNPGIDVYFDMLDEEFDRLGDWDNYTDDRWGEDVAGQKWEYYFTKSEESPQQKFFKENGLDVYMKLKDAWWNKIKTEFDEIYNILPPAVIPALREDIPEKPDLMQQTVIEGLQPQGPDLTQTQWSIILGEEVVELLNDDIVPEGSEEYLQSIANSMGISLEQLKYLVQDSK